MTSRPRHFENNTAPRRRSNAHEELLASLTRITLYNPPVQTCSTGWKFHGLYYGPTSVAYLFFRLSHLYPDLVFKGQSLLDWAQSYLDLGITGHRDRVDSNHCGIGSEVLTQLSIRAAIEQDPSLVQQLCSYESTTNGVGGSDEWLYGRSGYLYLLRLARSGFDNGSKTTRIIDATMDKTVQRVLASRQPWSWHGKACLGAVHGTFGILTQLILSSPSSADILEELLNSLLVTQYSSGNFPSSLPAGSDKLVQICHGGPGAVLTLRTLRPHFPTLHDKIDTSISGAQRDIWKRGLLTKDPCLCHGIPGNALALDDDAEFDHFLASISSEALEAAGWLESAGRDDEFVGLYTGEAGRAWAWAVKDKELTGKPCIGFNDL